MLIEENCLIVQVTPINYQSEFLFGSTYLKYWSLRSKVLFELDVRVQEHNVRDVVLYSQP